MGLTKRKRHGDLTNQAWHGIPKEIENQVDHKQIGGENSHINGLHDEEILSHISDASSRAKSKKDKRTIVQAWPILNI